MWPPVWLIPCSSRAACQRCAPNLIELEIFASIRSTAEEAVSASVADCPGARDCAGETSCRAGVSQDRFEMLLVIKTKPGISAVRWWILARQPGGVGDVTGLLLVIASGSDAARCAGACYCGVLGNHGCDEKQTGMSYRSLRRRIVSRSRSSISARHNYNGLHFVCRVSVSATRQDKQLSSILPLSAPQPPQGALPHVPYKMQYALTLPCSV